MPNQKEIAVLKKDFDRKYDVKCYVFVPNCIEILQKTLIQQALCMSHLIHMVVRCHSNVSCKQVAALVCKRKTFRSCGHRS